MQTEDLGVECEKRLRRLVAASNHDHSLSDLIPPDSLERKGRRLACNGRLDIDALSLDGTHRSLYELTQRVWSDEEVVAYLHRAAGEDA